MPQKQTEYVRLPHSLKAAPGMTTLGSASANDMIEVTIRVRRKQSIDEFITSHKRISHEEYASVFGASEQDMALVESFTNSFHLSLAGSDKGSRTMQFRGTVGNFESAFQVHLSRYRDGSGNVFRGRSGYIYIPKNLEGIIEGVFGLDNRPQANPKFQFFKSPSGRLIPAAATVSGYTANEVKALYGFPADAMGKGQTIAIIELGGGYRMEDIEGYFKNLQLPVPQIKSVSVDGGYNNPSVPDSADGEVALDIEVAAAVAPQATIVVYFSHNTDKGFLDAVNAAIHDTANKPSVISISWGSAESRWTSQSLNTFNDAFKSAAVLGISICAAAGDSGSADGQQDDLVHVDFPASSPYVLGCGGTRLTAENDKITSETVWHESDNSATGGGVSDFFPLPSFQEKAGVPVSLNPSRFKGRGVPDVAGNADPSTGYKVLVDGQEMVIGGTSAVAPLYAGLIAVLNEGAKNTLGYMNPFLYDNPNLCRDITQGDNITTANKLGYKAAQGWDACSGLGVLTKIKPDLRPEVAE